MKAILPFLFLIASYHSYSQPVFDNSDLPNVGDTFRLSIANVSNSFNGDLTGNDYLWDFSNIQPNGVQVDSFVSVTSTPISYNAIFNQPWDPDKATIASPQSTQGFTPPGLTITESYNYFKESTEKLIHLGFAAKVNNVPTPIKYDNPELWYNLPLTLGNVDSSQSFWDITVPSYGYMSEKRKRYNYVDGWGTLITPYDTFSVIRVKSVIFIHDSINYNGIGFPRDAIEYQYKWMTDSLAVPVLQITINGNNRKAYFYNPYKTSSSLNYLISSKNNIMCFPNPFHDYLTINLSESNFSDITIVSPDEKYFIFKNVKGSLKLNTEQFKSGIYFIRCSDGVIQKVIKN